MFQFQDSKKQCYIDKNHPSTDFLKFPSHMSDIQQVSKFNQTKQWPSVGLNNFYDIIKYDKSNNFQTSWNSTLTYCTFGKFYQTKQWNVLWRPVGPNNFYWTIWQIWQFFRNSACEISPLNPTVTVCISWKQWNILCEIQIKFTCMVSFLYVSVYVYLGLVSVYHQSHTNHNCKVSLRCASVYEFWDVQTV